MHERLDAPQLSAGRLARSLLKRRNALMDSPPSKQACSCVPCWLHSCMNQASSQTAVQQIPSQCRNQPHWESCRCHAHLQALNCLLCDVAILCMPPDFLCMLRGCGRHTLHKKVCLFIILLCQLHLLMAF